MKAGPYLFAAFAAIAAGGVLRLAWPRPIPTGIVEAGCALAILNGLAAATVNRLALHGQGGSSFQLAALGHGLRAAVLFVCVCGSVVIFGRKAAPFALAALAGYFCFLAAEVTALYGRALPRTGNPPGTGPGGETRTAAQNDQHR